MLILLQIVTRFNSVGFEFHEEIQSILIEFISDFKRLVIDVPILLATIRYRLWSIIKLITIDSNEFKSHNYITVSKLISILKQIKKKIHCTINNDDMWCSWNAWYVSDANCVKTTCVLCAVIANMPFGSSMLHAYSFLRCRRRTLVCIAYSCMDILPILSSPFEWFAF